MIDLHCHILPGIDDGAPDLAMALAMARVAVADGIRVTACTPHIYPGLYENDLAGIEAARDALAQALADAGIPLELCIGADTHLAPDLLEGLGRRIPTLAGSRYFLLEPPHHVAPPRLHETVFSLVAAGYVPIVTHPERLTWIEGHYPLFARLVEAGAWMQLTAGSLTGRFGARPKYWAERMEDEGLVHVVATDAHRAERRPPLLAEARDAVARRLGDTEALHQVRTRPQGVLDDVAPSELPPPLAAPAKPRPFWRRLALGA
jgi:protein-tyrosine phosphatase